MFFQPHTLNLALLYNGDILFKVKYFSKLERGRQEGQEKGRGGEKERRRERGRERMETKKWIREADYDM